LRSANLPNQIFVLITTAQAVAKVNVLLSNTGAIGQLLTRRPNLLLLGLLALVPLEDSVAAVLLEVEWALLHVGMELAVDEDAGFEVLLGKVAERLVLGHDALVHLVDALEVLFGRVAVTVDFVVDIGGGWACGHEFLHEEEVGAKRRISMC
jgi:hypothetical protein